MIHRHQCPACGACGMVGMGWFGFGGSMCMLCAGRGYLKDMPAPCPSCNTSRHIKKFGGLVVRDCGLCRSAGYIHRDRDIFKCIVCKAKGTTGIFKQGCGECQGMRYTDQIQCPRCVCSGACKTSTSQSTRCVLCDGKRYLRHRARECHFCDGSGITSCGFLGLWRQDCRACLGKGYELVDREYCDYSRLVGQKRKPVDNDTSSEYSVSESEVEDEPDVELDNESDDKEERAPKRARTDGMMV